MQKMQSRRWVVEIDKVQSYIGFACNKGLESREEQVEGRRSSCIPSFVAPQFSTLDPKEWTKCLARKLRAVRSASCKAVTKELRRES